MPELKQGELTLAILRLDLLPHGWELCVQLPLLYLIHLSLQSSNRQTEHHIPTNLQSPKQQNIRLDYTYTRTTTTTTTTTTTRAHDALPPSLHLLCYHATQISDLRTCTRPCSGPGPGPVPRDAGPPVPLQSADWPSLMADKERYAHQD